MSDGIDPRGPRSRIGTALDDPRPRSVAAVALVTLLVVPVIGLVLVTMANLVPDRPIMEELDAAVQAGRITPEFGPRSTSGRLLDTWTDCHTVTVGLGDAPDTSRWSAPLRSPTLGNCERAVERIEGWVNGEGLTREFEYFRYWHGTAAFSRPGMATIGLVGTRIATGWILVGAIAGLGWSLARRHGVVVSIALLGPFALTTDYLDLPTSLHQAWAVIAAIVVAWAGHEAMCRRPSPGLAVLVSIVAGAAFVFFDLLTIPPGAWALTVFVVLVAASRRLGGRSLAAIGALAVGGWVVGYAWMWVAKWLFAIPVYGVDRVRDDIVDQTTFRLDGQPDYGIDLSFGAGLHRTWSVWSDHPLTWPVLVALVAMVTGVVAVRLRRGSSNFGVRWPDRLSLLAPALLPPIWFEVVRNHTQIHAFPARSLPIAVGIVAAAIIVRLAPLDGRVAHRAAPADSPPSDAHPREGAVSDPNEPAPVGDGTLA